MRTNKYGCSLIIFFLSVYMHTAVLLDNACLENLSSNLLVIYDAHIKPHTCVKELSFQLNWNWEPPWSLGCLCCWKSWSLPHYLKEGKKAQCPNRIKQTVEQSSLVMQKHWLIPASVKMWVLQNYVSFFWPLPVEVSTADHPLPSQLIPCIFLSHQPSPCPPGCCIFDTLCPIYPLSPLYVCPNYLSLVSLSLSPNCMTQAAPLTYSFLILSILVTPTEKILTCPALQSIHNSKSHYNLVNLPFHCCCMILSHIIPNTHLHPHSSSPLLCTIHCFGSLTPGI